MTQHVACAVLAELGVLFTSQGGQAPCGEPRECLSSDHALHLHTPLWAYEEAEFAAPFSGEGSRPLYEVLTEDPGVDGILARTRLIVFLGALDSPTFRRFLDAPGVLLVIIEPCRERLERFAQSVSAQRLVNRAVIFHGEAQRLAPPLAMILPKGVFELGYPVFYGLPELMESSLQLVEEFVRILETLFYRHRVYSISGQSNSRGLPIRPMSRGHFFDQQLHAYENFIDYAVCPDIWALRKAFAGETAVLVGAGPDLVQQMEYLRGVRGAAVVIAVNNALKPLLAGGVRPHFVVANDTSMLTAQSWAGLKRMEDIALVGHCLIDLGGDLFARKYLFGNYRPETFGTRPNLRLHGSVITTAFSLARHMGCTRCILVGVELSSQNPWRLSYARGSIHASPEDLSSPPSATAPPLYSLQNSLGVTCYTTLNFLDAGQWLLDEIRHSGMSCVNVTRNSIVHGPGVEHVPGYPVAETGRLPHRLSRVAMQRHARRPLEPILDVVRTDLALWISVAASIGGILAKEGADFLSAAEQVLQQFDASNVSYLVQRFEDFDNQSFHRAVFESGTAAEKAEGLRYYLDHVRRMADRFAAVLRSRHDALAGLAARG